jgi:hypothetical protein
MKARFGFSFCSSCPPCFVSIPDYQQCSAKKPENEFTKAAESLLLDRKRIQPVMKGMQGMFLAGFPNRSRRSGPLAGMRIGSAPPRTVARAPGSACFIPCIPGKKSFLFRRAGNASQAELAG